MESEKNIQCQYEDCYMKHSCQHRNEANHCSLHRDYLIRISMEKEQVQTK